MPQAKNSPGMQTPLLLEARKSFALSLWIQDKNENPLDISGALLRWVVRKSVPPGTVDDSGNLIVNSQGVITNPSLGFAQFFLQATDLDHAPGEYQYAVVLSYQGYSSVILKGPLQIAQNTEFTSLTETYSDGDPATALAVVLREMVAIKVLTGPVLPPGAVTYTYSEQAKVNAIYAGMVAAGTTLTADDIVDGSSKVMMTVAEREALANLSLEWDDIIGKPDFGTAALEDVAYFLRPIANGGGVPGSEINSGTIASARLPNVSSMPGMVITTGAPVGGNPGRITLKYTP